MALFDGIFNYPNKKLNPLYSIGAVTVAFIDIVLKSFALFNDKKKKKKKREREVGRWVNTFKDIHNIFLARTKLSVLKRKFHFVRFSQVNA